MKGVNFTITVKGEAYPCRETMGAMLRFRRETGKDVSEMDVKSIADMCTYLWCCLSSACAYDGKIFDLSLMEFADSVGIDTLDEWLKMKNESAEPVDGVESGDEKKS